MRSLFIEEWVYWLERCSLFCGPYSSCAMVNPCRLSRVANCEPHNLQRADAAGNEWVALIRFRDGQTRFGNVLSHIFLPELEGLPRELTWPFQTVDDRNLS